MMFFKRITDFDINPYSQYFSKETKTWSDTLLVFLTFCFSRYYFNKWSTNETYNNFTKFVIAIFVDVLMFLVGIVYLVISIIISIILVIIIIIILIILFFVNLWCCCLPLIILCFMQKYFSKPLYNM